MQSYILSLVHHTHPAPAKFLDDSVVRNCLADEGVGLGRKRYLCPLYEVSPVRSLGFLFSSPITVRSIPRATQKKVSFGPPVHPMC